MNANNKSKQILKVSKDNVYTRQTNTQFTYLHSEAIFVSHSAVSIWKTVG